MVRRHCELSSIIILLLTTTATATEPVVDSAESRRPIDLTTPVTLDLSFNYDKHPSANSFLDAVTMASFPSGSLVIQFDGFHGFALKHARSQSRRLMRRAVKAGWYTRPDEIGSRRAFYERIDHAWAGPSTNGVWWTRSWWQSLPPEKGGAPAIPYVHTFGHETEWSLGPITVTNTFKLKFDYIAFFEVNPDPVSHEHGQYSTPISFDVRPAEDAVFGTQVKFRIKPHLRFGLPKSGDWLDVLRGASLKGTFEISRQGRRLVEGECEIKWRPRDGLVVTLEIALVSW